MMLREKTGGRTVNGEVGEREDEWGKDLEDAPTAYRCCSLRQRSAALSGHRKMVSVRGELTVAYNLMFSILDSFSMGNAYGQDLPNKARFSPLFSSLFIPQLNCSSAFFPPLPSHTFLFPRTRTHTLSLGLSLSPSLHLSLWCV
ncbi:hypothetical protein AMECASPLE_023269 [Ameca splendens]|uniref:Uncharacterized protein n=1 Tax=Ameca splendens TaxID=208324 RepID=A0ABV0YSA3_9TELE